MANYDLVCFLEYYQDRDSMTDPVSGLRTPSAQWQNFYQTSQVLTPDPNVAGEFSYLAFTAEGFGSAYASALNDLAINAVALASLVDITDAAMTSDNLVIASLYVQNAGLDTFDEDASAQLISRYIGSIMEASLDDTSVTWTVNPGIDKLNAQVPTRKITADMLTKKRGK